MNSLGPDLKGEEIYCTAWQQSNQRHAVYMACCRKLQVGGFSIPAVVHENKLEPSLIFPYMCWGGCYGIGQAGCFTQRLSDGLLHSLYGCCGRYELSKPEAEVLEELFRSRQLQDHSVCTDQLSAEVHLFGDELRLQSYLLSRNGLFL